MGRKAIGLHLKDGVQLSCYFEGVSDAKIFCSVCNSFFPRWSGLRVVAGDKNIQKSK